MTADALHAASSVTPQAEVWPPQTGKPRPSPEDPFYLPSAGWEQYPAGTVLRRRKVRVALFGVLPLKLRAWQLLYRTADLHGAPETTVTTVLVPVGVADDCPVIAYQCAIDAVTSRAFPSFGLQPGSFGINQLQNELLLMVAALAKGWIVTVSDHEGPQGLWMMARQPGYHVLDAIRATLAAGGEEGIPVLDCGTPVGIWGYSGGATASAWAAELVSDYAPELNLVGAVLGAPAAKPGSLVLYHSGRFGAGLIIPVLSALMRAHPQAHDFLRRHLNCRGLRVVKRAETMSLTQSVIRNAFTNFDKLVDRPVDELMAEPILRAITDEMMLGHHTPHTPVYLYHSVHDQLLPIAATDQLARRYTAGGTHVTYRRDRASEHISLALTGAADALAWLQGRIADHPLPEHPTADTVRSTTLNFAAIRGLLQWQWGIAKLFLGRL